jgi:hypothetical protein
MSVSGTGAKPLQLLSNRGFETDTDGDRRPNGWLDMGSGWNGSDGRECSVFYGGSCAVVLHGALPPADKELVFTANHSGNAGDKYVFSVYRRAFSVPPLSSTFAAHVEIYNGGPSPVDTKTINFPKGTYAFTKSSLSFTTTTAYTKFVVTFEYNAGSGTVYLDNASLIWNP